MAKRTSALTPEERQALSRNLIERLAALELSQAELARRVGAHGSTVNGWLQCEYAPSTEMIRRLARVLHVKPQELLR